VLSNNRIAVICLSISFLFAGCGGTIPNTDNSTPTPTQTTIPKSTPTPTVVTPTARETNTATPTPSNHPDLDSRLYGLVVADDRSDYADREGLIYENNSVQVVIELEPGASLPTRGDIVVELRHDNLVQGFVSVEALIPLARDNNVSAVRPPTEPQPN